MRLQRGTARHVLARCVLLWLALVANVPCFGAPQITEFMAANNSMLADEDGEFSDWIEIYNPDSAPLALAGYHLSDDPRDLGRWTFPALTLNPGAYLVVFASGKNRSDPNSRLHTDFQLSAEGEYLALSAPDGKTVVSAFAPVYPPQFANESFGLGQLESSGDVPLTPVWSFPGNYANVYITGARSSAENLGSNNLDLGSGGANSQAYLWFDFSSRLAQLPLGTVVENAALSWSGTASSTLLGSLTVNSMLGVFPVPDGRHGIEVVAANFTGRDMVDYSAAHQPLAAFNIERGQRAAATWNIAPLVQRWVDDPGLPQRGQIMLLNASRPMHMNWDTDASGKPALTLDVTVGRDVNAAAAWSAFAKPTPGAANVNGVRAGPMFGAVDSAVPPPAQGPLTVVVRVNPINDPVAAVKLYYRRMFATETSLAMSDDGTGGDAVRGDGVWTARIPAAAFVPGEMTRWRFVANDIRGIETSEPAYREPADSPRYFGTVTQNPAIQTRLPVLHWFTSNAAGAATTAGSRASVYYDGELYDNVLFSLHGQSSAGFPKKSYNIDFSGAQRFRWSTNAPRVADIDLLTNWADKSKARHVLAYEVMRESGVAAHFAYTVRVEQNGKFFSTADLVEDADEIYLKRAGLNEQGALYKIYANTLNKDSGNTATSGVEKKTRRFENNADLQELINGLDLTGAALTRYLFDSIDIPQCVNLLAVNSVIRNIDMHSKNWYIYRDTGRSGEWAMLPWDLDLSHGRSWDTQNTYFDNALYTNGFVVNGTAIRLVSHLFANSAIRTMILRRIRTLTDRFLQPPPRPGTADSELYYERRLNELSALIDPPEIVPSDARRDFEKWGSWLQRGTTVSHTNASLAVETMTEAIQRWRKEYLPGRRTYIYNTQIAGKGGEIPLPQAPQSLINFGAIEFSPASQNQDQEFIQLVNPNSFAVDLSGWRLSGGIEHTIKPGTVLAPRGWIYVCPDAAAFRARTISPKGGEGLLVQGGYQGHLSSFGETLTLLDAAGATNNTMTYQGQPSDAQRYLVLGELMFHPSGDGRAEFIELLNISDTLTLDLTNVRFTQGVEFNFTGSARTTLPPKARVLIVRDLVAFTAVHGAGQPIAGVFSNSTALNNGGEIIKLEDVDGGTVLEFNYDDQPPWPASADGSGYSLVLVAPSTKPDPALALNWRASFRHGGSPGGTDVAPFPTDPLADADGNGERDLLDYALGNILGLPPRFPALVPQSNPLVNPASLFFTYPLNREAEHARIEVFYSTDMVSWQSAMPHLEVVSTEQLGDGRALITWRVKPALRGEPQVLLRLRAVGQ